MRVLPISIVALVTIGFGASNAFAGYSIYEDVWMSEAGVVYGTSTVEDTPEEGCDHINFNTLATVTSPTSRTDSSNSPGMHSEASLDSLEEEGYFNLDSSIDLYCTCGGNVNYGASSAIHAFVAPYFYEYTVQTAGGPIWRYERCGGGMCSVMYFPPFASVPPLYRKYFVLRNSNGSFATCFTAFGRDVSSCAG